MSFQVKELLLSGGDSPFAKWFDSLEAVAAAKVRVAVSRMEQGNLSNCIFRFIVTAHSGIVTGNSGHRDRGLNRRFRHRDR
jgi:hypothetical protein